MLQPTELVPPMGHLDSSDEEKEKETVSHYLADGKLSVRIEDDKGEMPLHKLARVKPEAGPGTPKMDAFDAVFDKIVEMSKAQAKSAGKSFAADVNRQDNR